MDTCPFFAYCVIELNTVFHDLLFWRFMLISQILPNKDGSQTDLPITPRGEYTRILVHRNAMTHIY